MGAEIVFENALIAIIYLIPGYLLCKAKILKGEHLPGISGILVYFGTPCLIISSFISLDYTAENGINMLLFFLATLILQLAGVLLIYFVFLCKAKDKGRSAVISLTSTMGNVGFFGLPVIVALFPNNPEVACYSCIYSLTMNIIALSVGVFFVTNDKKHISLKSILISPPTVSMVIAIPLFLLGSKNFLPQIALNSLSVISKMTTPLCMIVLGARLAQMSFKSLFTSVTAYLICLVKLIIFPLICYLAVVFLPLGETFKASMLILSATPCAAVVLNISEMYKADATLVANSTLLSNILCVATLPLLALIL